MAVRNLTCIGCPLGCPIQVTMNDSEITDITGFSCKRGKEYAKKEVTHPTRIVTSTVRVIGGNIPMVSVKTASDIPKEKIMEIMKCLEEIRVVAPIHIGDVILENVAGTNVNIVATKNIQSA